MSRLEKSTKNIVFSFGNNLLASLLGFVSRTIFIATLGSEYLGLSGLLQNVLGFLAISELGIATAIGFSLYKPLAEKDYKSVSALMSLYRKAYSVIGVFVLVSGIGLFYFLDFFIPIDQQPPGTDFAYFVFLINTALGYFFSYRRTLISSDNQGYRVVPIDAAASIIQTVAQIILLLITKSYIYYLVAHIVCSVTSMIVQNRYITSIYKEVDFHSKDKLELEQKRTIKRNVGGLIIAKVGDYLVNSTDNLIITKLVSLAATGIYSNYLLLRNLVNGYISTLFSGVTAGMGNVVAVETDKKKKEIYDTMMFCSFFIYSFEAVCFICLFNPFIKLWIGEKYLFDMFTVTIIVINNYLTGLRIPLITMKGAAGTYMEDSWVPFAFAGINLVASVILVKYMGVAGVFLGTIVGSILTADWYRPIVIYRKVFHAPVREYYKKYILYLAIGFGYMALAYWICSYIRIHFAFLAFICKACVAALLPILLNILFFHRTAEFAAVCDMGKRLFNGTKSRFARLFEAFKRRSSKE